MSGRRVDLLAPPSDVAAAGGLAAAVQAAGLVCFPTDTVYGVGGVVRPQTVAAIEAAKGREPGKPLQVIFPDVDLLLEQLAPGPRLCGAVRRLLPGPLTLVVPYPDGWTSPPPGFAGGVATLGVRAPRWPHGARLLQHLGVPLIASSANRSGEAPARDLATAEPAILAACDLLLDGGTVDGRASAVVDLSRYENDGSWRLLRAGAWDEERLAAVLARPEGG